MKTLFILLTLVLSTVNAGVVSVTYTDDFNNTQTYVSQQCVLNDHDTPEKLFKSSFESGEYVNRVDDYYFNVDCVDWNLQSQFADVDDTFALINDVPNLCLTQVFNYNNDGSFYIQMDCISQFNP